MSVPASGVLLSVLFAITACCVFHEALDGLRPLPALDRGVFLRHARGKEEEFFELVTHALRQLVDARDARIGRWDGDDAIVSYALALPLCRVTLGEAKDPKTSARDDDARPRGRVEHHHHVERIAVLRGRA